METTLRAARFPLGAGMPDQFIFSLFCTGHEKPVAEKNKTSRGWSRSRGRQWFVVSREHQLIGWQRAL